MTALRSATTAVLARPGTAAIVALGVAFGLVMHSMGWAQLAHYAQVRTLADGTAEIDRYHWETNDKAYVDGHFYSVKSPGVAALSVPVYLGIEALGGKELAREAAANARETADPRWDPPEVVPLNNYGYSFERGRAVELQIEQHAPLIWALTLIAAVIPAVLLLFGVRWAADRLEPGYGTAAAITLGLCTIVLVFASEYFSHVIGAALGFAAFLVLWREREGPSRPRAVAIAGLLAGLAVSFELQVGLVGAILFLYALAGRSERLRRAGAYAAGAVCGALPLLAFNAWAFGNPLQLAYGDAVAEPGLTGHDELGLSSDGIFGIMAPRLDGVAELLLSSRGLLVVTPIVAMAVVGVFLMRRRGYRSEANVVGAIALGYFLYNAGYWLPMGGGTPGPRFLIPMLPFLALGLAFAYRRYPALTLALAIPSGVFMTAASLTFPLLGDQGSGEWAEWFADGRFEHTLLTVIGVSNAWLAIAPVLAALAAAVVLAVRATPRTPLDSPLTALGAVAAWAAISALGPVVADSPTTPLDDPQALWLIGVGAAGSTALLAWVAWRRRLAHPAAGETADAAAAGSEAPAPEPALGERIP